MTEDQVRRLLRRAVTDAGSAQKYARSIGVYSQQVNTALHGGPIARKVAEGLGLRPVTVYEKSEESANA